MAGEKNIERYVAFHDFEGVDLTSSPDGPKCIDMLNVDSLERRGAVLTRPAWVNRGPGLDAPIVAHKHGQVQDGSDGGDVSVFLVSGEGTWLPYGSFGGFKLADNTIVPLLGTSAAIYNDTRADAEVFVTIAEWDAISVLGLRLRVQGAVGTGITGVFNPLPLGGLQLIIYETEASVVVDEAEVVLGDEALSAGAKVGMRAVGSTVDLFFCPSGGDWINALSKEATILAAGRPSIIYNGPQPTQSRLDNFGTGPSTGATFPENSVTDDFDRADEPSIFNSPSLVAYHVETGSSISEGVEPSMFLDAVQYAADSGSVILATENIKTATNVGINVIEADNSDPYVKITPMAYQSGPPDAPDLDWVKFLGVQQPDNRVVAAGVGKGLNHEARVYFSDPGDYTAWNAENYIDLGANDGEVFTGICDWRGQLWVFKETRAFVFYGNSVDRVGGVEFNYRTVDLGSRVVPRNLSGSYALGPGVVAGENGIYFVGADGIYLMDGRDAVKVSEPVDAVVSGQWETVGGSGGTDQLTAGLHYTDRRLYVLLGARVLVWDELRRGWLIWQSPAAAAASWIGAAGVTDSSPALALVDHSDGNNLWSLARASERSQATDGSDPIPARYRLGFSDFGSDYEDRIEETRITGSGTVEVTVSKDFERDGLTEELELTDPAAVLGVPRQKRFKHGLDGVVFSTEISGDAPWAVHRIVHAVSSQKAAGTS